MKSILDRSGKPRHVAPQIAAGMNHCSRAGGVGYEYRTTQSTSFPADIVPNYLRGDPSNKGVFWYVIYD